MDVVSLANPKNAATMADLADTTGGQVIPAEQDALDAVFSAQADALAQQLLVTFDRPEDVAAEVNLGVTVDAGGTSFTDSAFVSIGAGESRPDIVTSGKSLVGTPGMLAGALALALGLAGLLAVVIGGPNASSADRRLDDYFGEKGAGGHGQAQGQQHLRPQGLRRRPHRQGGLGRPRDARVAAARGGRVRAHRGRVAAGARRRRHRLLPSSGSS